MANRDDAELVLRRSWSNGIHGLFCSHVPVDPRGNVTSSGGTLEA